MTAFLRSKGLWMYLEKLLSPESDNSYDIMCLEKDEALELTTLYVELDLVHRTKDNKSAKQIWDIFHDLFGTVNTTQVCRLEIELSNLKMADLSTIEYIAKFKTLKVHLVTSGGQGKYDYEYNNIVPINFLLHSIILLSSFITFLFFSRHLFHLL
jgi:hypothetical protein